MTAAHASFYMRHLAGLMLGLAAFPLLAGQKESSRPRSTFVELDAVVVDNNGQPLRGLLQQDFQIKEDGRAVAVTSFGEVSANGIAGPTDSRSIVLLLDDTGIGPPGTVIVQNIARLFLSRARPADAVAVVRLTHREDEAIGSLQIAHDRIDEYQSKSVPYFGRETIEESLQALTRVSMQLELSAHRRKAVVCIGRRSLCDLYLAMPHASGSNNFTRAVDQIWDEAGHYYLLGYTPTARPRELHSINVTVKRKGSHVRARLNRGD